MTSSFDQSEFETLLEKLATTPGPSLLEGPRTDCLKDFFHSKNIPTTQDGAGNLWVSFGPDSWENTVIFDAHVDVVGKGVAEKIKIDGEKIIGAGVYDDLAAVTLLSLFCEKLSSQAVKSPIKVIFSVGEEGMGNLKGMRQMVNDQPQAPKLFISFDLSVDHYSPSALGSIRLRAKAQGQGGHSWNDFGKASAIDVVVELLAKIKMNYQQIAGKTKSPLSYNIGSIQGGEGINCISREAQVEFEFRSTNPKLLKQMHEMVSSQINEMKIIGIHWNLEVIGERPAAEPSQANPWYEDSILKVWKKSGLEPRPGCQSTNINIPLSKGWPSLCVGLVRGGNVHREDEYLERSSLNQGWNLLNELTTELGVV